MIHKALKIFRIYHNLNQKELASKLDISPSYLSAIECGSKQVNYQLLSKYSEALNIPISSILLFSEESDSTTKGKLIKAATKKTLKVLEWLDDNVKKN